MTETTTFKEQVYADYHDKVRYYIQGKVSGYHDVEDLTSEVFLKVYNKLDSFDGAKASLSTWIYTITRNTVIDFYRTSVSYSELPDDLSVDDSVESNLIREESLEQLAIALESLDERERDIIILHYYSGQTLKTAADSLGISYSYAKIIHKKALSGLKKSLRVGE